MIFITSCDGQNKKNIREDRVIQSIETPDDSSESGRQINVDPLFYIDGQVSAWVRRIFQDRSGNLWFGTNHYGVIRYDGDTLEYFTEKHGLGFGRITGIVEDKEGHVWFGTAGGLTKYGQSDGQAVFVNFTEEDGLINNEVWSLTIDSEGTFWIGTLEGVSRFDGEVFNSFPIPKAEVSDTTTILSYNRISSIMEDKNGALWFGTDGFGISKYDGKSFTHLTKMDGLSDNNVAYIMEDKMGNIWIGTMYGGISRYDGKSFTNFTENGDVKGVEVYGLYEDKSGNIWFPAEGYGVYHYDGKSFTNFHETEGLNTHGIQCFYEDREGRFWLGGWGGLFRYEPYAGKIGAKSFFSVTRNGPWE